MFVCICLTETYLFFFSPAAVIFYEYYVPVGERLESALKRHKDALTTELKIWEGYLQKVNGNYKHKLTKDAVKYAQLLLNNNTFLF